MTAREIIPNLWQGPGGRDLHHPFRAVVSCCEDVARWWPPPSHVTHRLVPFPPVLDADGQLHHHDIPPIQELTAVADEINGWLDNELPVLVRCMGGHNRSGLVVALTLTRRGHTPAQATSIVQAHPGNLAKRRYEQWLQEHTR